MQKSSRNCRNFGVECHEIRGGFEKYVPIWYNTKSVSQRNSPLVSLVLSGAHLMLRQFSFWNPTDAARGWMGGWHFCVWLAICVSGAESLHLRLNSSGAQKYCALFVTAAGAIRSFSGATRIVAPPCGAQKLKRKNPVCF